MSKMRKNLNKENINTTTNYMGGKNYIPNPLTVLKMITASSIFGEPQYYRRGEFANKKIKDGKYISNELFEIYDIMRMAIPEINHKKTSDIMEEAIDNSLDFDFENTLRWAVTLRKEYNMRLNPQIIMVRASFHPKRTEFTSKTGGLFREINQMVMSRADEPNAQLTYWLYKNNNSTKNIPMILKRSWAEKLESTERYALNKYKNVEGKIINTVRISHANSPAINELMKTGKISVESNQNTWENLKSNGKTWSEILKTIEIPHMALLRNLRGIFTEIEDVKICKSIMKKLVDGVKNGKQFPFRYMSAMKAIEKDNNVNHKSIILDGLEECMDLSSSNMPQLKGKTMCLTDNSGSAWGTFNSEYGTVTVAEIGNLSSVITARNSEEGYVGVFGDKLETIPITKRNGILNQSKEVSEVGKTIGGATENGVWIFLKNAIEKKEHWDNIFIYSDQQAGHGDLYGTSVGIREYTNYLVNERYLDVSKLIDKYRKEVNPKVNVFSIQTAGYGNAVIPEYGYRTNLMYGWTGKELVFADTMINLWDKEDSK